MKPTRRQLIVGTGAISIGTVGTMWSMDSATAIDVSIGSLTIPNVSHTGGFEKIEVEVQGEFRWKDANADTLEVVLAAGDPNADPTELDTQTTSISSSTGTHETDLRDDILESATLGKGDFELLPGQPQSETPVKIQLIGRLKSGSQIIAENTVSTEPVITINEQSAEITLGGTGEIIIS